jgi:outer membrane protein TolC
MVGPDFSSPSAPVADKWLEAHDPSVKSASSIAPGHREDWAWWAVFHDPILDRLIKTAYDQNLSLTSAGTRVLQARAELGVAIGEFYPQLQQAKGSILYDRPSHADPTANPRYRFLTQLLARLVGPYS